MTGEDRFNAVVIGSGFGGSITALRLAKARKKVLVLERGQPYPPGSFARTPHAMSTNFWAPENNLYGLFDIWAFKHLDVVLASGLGGGSLIYANVMLRKDASTFVREDLRKRGYEDWPLTRADLDRHYDEVQSLLDPKRYPYADETPKTDAMKEAAEAMGLKADLPCLAIAFSGQGEPLGSPVENGHANLHGAPRSTCRLCGECDIGCNYGAKNTLDFNCLSQAKDEGATLRTCCEANTIEPLDRSQGSGYVVRYRQHLASKEGHPRDLLDDSEEDEREVYADTVVLAAGAIGTPRLLLKNRASLRRLSPALGSRISANGDYFGWARDCRDPKSGQWRRLEPSRGPVITASIHVDEQHSTSGRGFYLQDAGAPPIADWFWESLELPQNLWRARSSIMRRAVGRLRGKRETHESRFLAEVFGDAHRSSAMMPLLGMGRDIPNGQLQLDGDQLQLDWSPEPSSAYYRGVRAAYEQFARALGGKLREDGLERRGRAITVHPVGGAGMSEDPRNGVVDEWGRVHGHPGLWIADGSVMPGPVGANPSFTIAALADRFAEKMLETMTD